MVQKERRREKTWYLTDMSSIASALPAPRGKYVPSSEEEPRVVPAQEEPTTTVIPAYPNRLGWVPRVLSDHGDGGAYPEIHVLQYPLNMGKASNSSSSSSSNLLSLTVVNGQASYDVVSRQNRGATQQQLLKTSLSDMNEANTATLDAEKLAIPSREEQYEVAERTRQSLQALMEGKLKKASGITAKKTSEELEPTYIRYAPNPDAPGFNPAAKQRVIRVVDAQVDPMEPSKFKHTKTPAGPPEAPVPVLHSPPRKLTVEDQQAWKIPPCISNWKNAQGFIIPLDKRLAADGRGLQEVTINNKFAALSEALYVSERKAAEDLRVRNQIRKKMALKEKEDKEAELRELASKARLERAGLGSGAGGGFPEELEAWRRHDDHQQHAPASFSSSSHGAVGALAPGPSGGRGRGATLPSWMTQGTEAGALGLGGAISSSSSSSSSSSTGAGTVTGVGGKGNDSSSDGDNDDDDDDEEEGGGGRGREKESRAAFEQREALRQERRKERERELRLEGLKVGPSPSPSLFFPLRLSLAHPSLTLTITPPLPCHPVKTNHQGSRKMAADRDEGRDVSEKIALGMHTGAGAKQTGDGMFDSRLFNQTAGLDSGFGADDEYNAYSKPLFDRDAASAVYRPRKAEGEEYGDADGQVEKLRDTSRFKADTGFAGAEGGARERGGRAEPVQFEKAKHEDVFGLGDLTAASKRPRKE